MPKKAFEKVRVVVRCRPMSIKEHTSGHFNIVEVIKSQNAIKIYNPRENELFDKVFTFDAVYDGDSRQEDVCRRSVQPIIDSVMCGYNATIFAYGQTGTGKTYTMEGNQSYPYEKGVISFVFNRIFNHINESSNTIRYRVYASYIQIYLEKVNDLLSDYRRNFHEFITGKSGILSKDIKCYICRNVEEIEAVMEYGKRNRNTGATDLNQLSSRSHAIFIISVQIGKKTKSGVKYKRFGKLNLVDLAGSERQSKSRTRGQRLIEATKVNMSLSALGNVISALSTGKKAHIPYRNSKLTRFLQDSLGGNSKTLMIANIGPASYNFYETISTLRYANRAKYIKNKPKKNTELIEVQIRKYEKEEKRLKNLLQSKLKKVDDAITDEQFLTQFEQQNRFLIEEKQSSMHLIVRKLHLIEVKLKERAYILEIFKNQTNSIRKIIEDINKSKARQIKLELDYLKKKEETKDEFDGLINNEIKEPELQEYITNTVNKLQNLCSKIEAVKDQGKKLIETFNEDVNNIEIIRMDLIKRYKYNEILNDTLITQKSKDVFMSQVYYDETSETWNFIETIT